VASRRTVWLVGMMGCGKSSVGLLLSARLKRPFIDTDSEIEREAGSTVSEIFAREGEAGFRARERAAIEAAAGSGAVVALGGGAIAQEGAAGRLAASGTIVYLRARPETLLRRLDEDDTRPLLQGLDGEARRERIERLLSERTPYYEQARIVIETDEQDAEALAKHLARRLQKVEA
jgi:shikimate kinase